MATDWPEFFLLDESGKQWSRNDLLGSWWLIYVYPKDDTPGCTRQSCEMNSMKELWAVQGVGILGISGDSALSHQKFKARYGLEFPLLVDDQLHLMRALDTWKLKSMYGKTYWGAERSAFLINTKAEIVWSERAIKLDGHLERVSAAITEQLCFLSQKKNSQKAGSQKKVR